MPSPRLDLDERNYSAPLHDEIDVSVTAPEASGSEVPTLGKQPTGRDALSKESELLWMGHGRQDRRSGLGGGI